MRFSGKFEFEASTQEEWAEMRHLLHVLLGGIGKQLDLSKILRFKLNDSDWQAAAAITQVQWPVRRASDGTMKISVQGSLNEAP